MPRCFASWFSRARISRIECGKLKVRQPVKAPPGVEIPFAWVRLHADRAYVYEISPAELLPWTIRIAKRYMGTEQADAYGRRNAVDGELLIRVPLTKVTARKGIAEW
jgi:hypothetical protein